MPLTLTDLEDKAFRDAVKHGLYDDKPSFSECIAAIHAELSEALEEHKAGNRVNRSLLTPPPIYYSGNRAGKTTYGYAPSDKNPTPEGYAVELADVVIWVASLCGYLGINLEAVVQEKMQYNVTRTYQHKG